MIGEWFKDNQMNISEIKKNISTVVWYGHCHSQSIAIAFL